MGAQKTLVLCDGQVTESEALTIVPVHSSLQSPLTRGVLQLLLNETTFLSSFITWPSISLIPKPSQMTPSSLLYL